MKIDTRTKNALAKKKIFNRYQASRFAPKNYIDNTTETGVSEELNGKQAVVIGKMTKCELKDMSSRPMQYLSIWVQDRKTMAQVHAMMFGPVRHAFQQYKDMVGSEVILCGILKYNPSFPSAPFTIMNPDTLSLSIESNLRIVPVYRKIKGVSEEKFTEVINNLLVKDPEEETIPQEYLSAMNLMPIADALKAVMFPRDTESIQKGKQRLIFDDLLYLETELLSQKRDKKTDIKVKSVAETKKMIGELPYELTADQKSCTDAIVSKMKNGELVNALIQGDVGCGKTIIAFTVMSAAVENGYQAVLMAPTQILATQHYKKLCSIFGEERVCLFDNTIKGKKRESALQDLRDGKYGFIVGTHALLSQDIKYHNLGVGIVDEEHRFGVEQRSILLDRGIHTITMSATPIPRTLASVLYGDDIDIFQIVTKPGGRKDTITKKMGSVAALDNMSRYLEKGGQIYVVCPLIEEAEEGSKMEGIASAETAYESCRRKFGREHPVGLVTGNMKKDEKDHVISSFRDGKLKVLVATTVIEVGVDVPSANMIVIQNAERFGLASLHQLRGRVGRGSEQAYCLLVSDKDNDRLDVMCRTNNGFEIAEADLEQRRAGNIIGSKQSGFNQLVEEMIAYPKLTSIAKKLAARLISEGRHEAHINKYRMVYAEDNPLDA